MLKINVQDFKKKTQIFTDYYSLQNFDDEAELWYNHRRDKQLSNKELESLDLCEVVKETGFFFPIIKQALHITLALSCTTSTIERSFSTLRRVKTWLRSTMAENCLNGKN
uniref:HAT C-terminal dimerisation domain-containing protein n=1 Tax=Sipha flava TaxID=143950 RepID=A0A2S2QYP3_9HEMI